MISTVFVLFLAVHALHSAAVPNGKDVEMLGQLIGTTLVRPFLFCFKFQNLGPPIELFEIKLWH